MRKIDNNPAPTSGEVKEFVDQVGFQLPEGFIAFFSEANGAIITSDTGQDLDGFLYRTSSGFAFSAFFAFFIAATSALLFS
jgi:hypothetical protein